jgi:hypothetical protein
VQKIDYQERNLLQEEKEGENNRIEDSFGSDDEMNRVFTINCQPVTVPFVFFFLRTAADPRNAFAISLARKSFHLKLRIEVEYQSPLLASLVDHLGIRLEKTDFSGLFRHFSQATFFLLQLTFVQERDKGSVRERVLLRAKTHSRKVARQFKRLFDSS